MISEILVLISNPPVGENKAIRIKNIKCLKQQHLFFLPLGGNMYILLYYMLARQLVNTSINPQPPPMVEKCVVNSTNPKQTEQTT